MVEKEATQITDRSEAPSFGSGSGAFQEINSERAAFVNRQKQDATAIKEGTARSFVTDQLGKVSIVDNEKTVGRQADFKSTIGPVEMPLVGGTDTSVRMPQLGGTDRSVRMPTADQLIVQPSDLYFKRTAAADLYTGKSDAHGEVEFKSAAKAHARVAESKGHKEPNAPHETDRGSFITHTDKNGTRKYTYADRTTETVSKDGKERDVMYPDGSGYHLYRDG